jgi:predicted nucleic acid-binding protein
VAKNLTVKLSEEAIRWAPRKAAEENTSVSRLVGEMLERQMRSTDEYRRAFDHWKSNRPLAQLAPRVGWDARNYRKGADAFFVDSNLLLYFVDPVEPGKQARAAEWLGALWETGSGRLSWQVRNEFYWNAVEKMRLEPAKAREIVEDLSHWNPVGPSMGVVHEAWQWTDTTQVSYRDARILACAQRSGSRAQTV